MIKVYDNRCEVEARVVIVGHSGKFLNDRVMFLLGGASGCLDSPPSSGVDHSIRQCKGLRHDVPTTAATTAATSDTDGGGCRPFVEVRSSKQRQHLRGRVSARQGLRAVERRHRLSSLAHLANQD